MCYHDSDEMVLSTAAIMPSKSVCAENIRVWVNPPYFETLSLLTIEFESCRLTVRLFRKLYLWLKLVAVMGTTLADASVLAGADPVAPPVEDFRTQSCSAMGGSAFPRRLTTNLELFCHSEYPRRNHG
jgi:hypothetical protein